MPNQLILNTASLEELKARVNALPEPEIMQDGKTATPTKATQTIVPDSGFGGLSSVTVNPIPDNYITTDDATAVAGDILSGKTAYVDGTKVTGTIATKTASNLTASGATVTVPAGYYASQATKSVTTATQATPSISVSSAGLITASSTQSTGYVSKGTKSATKQLTVQAAKTVTPTKSSQTAVASGRYTTGAVTVAAIPDKYEDRTESLPQLNTVNGGTAATTIAAAVNNTETLVSDEAALITQIQTALEGTTYDPSGLQKKIIQPMVDDQIITADTSYQALSQVTVKGDTNLKGENIISGVSIFGVPGTYDVSSALQEKSITPATNTQIITADDPYAGLSRVTVNGDSDLVAENIKSGVSIFGVAGIYGAVDPVLQEKSITPTANTQIITADVGYEALSKVIIDGDADLIAENIKSGISIFGVEGNYEGSGSGGGSAECQVATGTFTISECTESNALLATIDGLPFIPRFVLCILSSSFTTTSTSVKRYFAGFSTQLYDENGAQLEDAQVGSANVKGLRIGSTYTFDPYLRYIRITPSSSAGSFTVNAGAGINSTNAVVGGTYNYYAIG